LKQGKVNLDDPATTVALLKLDAVVGLKGFFQGDNLNSIGITCGVCHSTVDNSLTFGVGHRLDGWANRDLDVGKIVAAAPDLPHIPPEQDRLSPNCRHCISINSRFLHLRRNRE
jgi:hypothetical protein